MPTFPLVLFAFNRPDHVRRTLTALSANTLADQTDLFVFCDGARSDEEQDLVEEVRRVCKAVTGFRSVQVTERETNLGLAASIRQGVTEVLEQSEAVIVMEDDLVAHPFFLRFMNEALHRYQVDDRLLSVSGYVPPSWRLRIPSINMPDVWLSRRNISTGWGTWKEAWSSVDWNLPVKEGFAEDRQAWSAFAKAGGEDLPWMLKQELNGEIESWSIRFTYTHVRSGRFALLPGASYLKQIGFDGSGRHCLPNPLRWLESTRKAKTVLDWPETLLFDERIHCALADSFSRHHRWCLRLGIIPEEGEG